MNRSDEKPVVTIHVANTETGEYDVHEPLPYPFHIDADGRVCCQDFWRGEPERLIGFQQKPNVMVVDLDADAFLTIAASKIPHVLAASPVDPVGMWPVFQDASGEFWAHRFPVSDVTFINQKEHTDA